MLQYREICDHMRNRLENIRTCASTYEKHANIYEHVRTHTKNMRKSINMCEHMRQYQGHTMVRVVARSAGRFEPEPVNLQLVRGRRAATVIGVLPPE